MQYSQEHLKTMVYAEFGGQTECIMGNWKIVNESQIKMESIIGKNYREFILATRCTGLCTVYPAMYSAQLTNEAHLALYNCRILSLMDYY